MASPLATLADYFKHHRGTDEPLVLGSGAQKSIVAYQTSHGPYEAADVEAVVAALDVKGPALCERLNGFGAVILCSVFLHSEPCLAQQRGLYLLAASIHQTESDPSYVAAGKAKKKSEMSAALPPLIKDFVSPETPEQSRRWTGVLALELLTKCAANVRVLRKETHGRWRHLSEVVMLSKGRILRHLAGSIMRQLVSNGMSLELFHEVEHSETLLSRFPTGQCDDSQWIISFQNFVEDMPTNHDSSPEAESSTFACGVRFGEVSYIIDDEAAILVTVGSDLSVLVPPSMRGPAVFIDILVKYVRAITTDSRQNTQSQSPTYALQMDLDQGGDTPFYVNASPTNESCIFLAFKSESVTSHVKSAVESRVAATEEHMLFKHSESEAIDVSKRRLDNGSNELDHLTDPSSDNNDHSVQDGSTFPVESADLGFGRGPTQQQRPVSLVQEMIERATFRNDSRYNLPSIAMAVIDVSISRESEANAEGVNAVAQGMSDSNMISSLPGQSGLDLIDSASQVQDPLVEGERSSSKVTATKRRKKNTKDDNMVTILESRNEGLLKAQFQPRPSKPVGQVHRKVCAPEDSTPSVIPAKFPTTELHDGRDRISATPPSMSKPLFTKIDSRNGLKPQPTSTQITKPYVKATPKVSSIVPRQKKSGTQGKGQCTVKSATNVNDEFSLPQSPPSHGSSLSQVRSKEFAQKRSTIQKGDSQAATTRPAPSLQDTNSGMTRQLAKAAFAPSNVKDNSIIPSNDVAARDSAMWEEGLSVQPGDASRAQIARNRGNQSKKRSAKLPKAPVAGASDGKAATINNHGHASKSAQPRKVPAKFATEADVTPAARIQPRSKRAAAVKANKRIEHQLDSEEESNSEFMLVDTNVPRGVGQTPLGTVQNEAADTVKSKHTEGHDLITNTEADKDNTSMLKVTTTVTAPVLRSQGKKQANPLKPAVQGEIDSPNKANLIIPTKPTAAIQCPQSDSKLDVSSDASFSEQPGDDLTLPLNEITHDEREFDDGSPSLVSHHTVDVAAPLIENKIDTRPVVYSKAPLPTATALAKISDVEVWHCDGDRNVQSISQSDKHVEQAQGRCRGPVAAPAQQDRYTNKQDRPMGIPSKKGVSIGPKSSNPSKDPFAARLRNAMPDNANHSTQHIARQPKPKTSTSTHSEQVLVPTQVKGVDSVIEPHQEVRDRLPAQNLKMGIPSATSGSKRKAVEPEERLSKRVKAKALPHTSPLIPTKSGNVQKDAKTPNTSIDRKAAMVSFDKSGPRNQGMSSRRHVGGDNASSSAPLRRDLKAGSRVRGPARGTQAHAAKEIGSPERVPKASASLADALFATNKPPFQVINNQPDVRVSSQTRITAGGSPIVVMVNGRDNIVEENTSTDGEAVEDALTAARLDDDEDVTMNESRDDEFVLLGFDSSLGTHVDLASIQVPSRNRKQQPTSPLAASTFAKLNKHQVRDNGTIINVDTKKAVVPTLPHDPFEAAGSKRNSSFMEALRKSTVSEDVSREKAKAPKAGIRKSLAAMEDPDKTLVDDPRIRTAERSKEARAISSSSLSSSGSSNAADPTKVPEVNSKSGSDTAHECYAPHQENMYLVLSGIVNRLVQRQIKREGFLQDTIEEYVRGGNALVQHFIDECHENLQANKEKAARTQADVIACYKQSMQDLSNISKRISMNQTKGIETQWHDRQRKLLDAANAALAACETETS